MDALVTLFLCGDVMTGRGIDQVLPHPGDPRVHEPVVRNAMEYVTLAERAHGRISKPVDHSYVWGHALVELARVRPDVRIVNLETAVTTGDEPWPGKPVHYRMHPRNVPVLEAAGIHCCVLANNHTLDWGVAGLEETLDTVGGAGIRTAGAGRNLAEAAAPAVLDHAAGGRVLVFGFGSPTSGIPSRWAAGPARPGVRLLQDLSPWTARTVARDIRRERREGDVVVASIHWGPNWGYGIPPEQRAFAHGLIDEAGVDAVHGHSSHHAKGIEVHRGKPILYGCGDFLNDYEGISGYEEFRDDLSLMYFPTFDPADGTLTRFEITPLMIRRFRLEAASDDSVEWLRETLDREGRPLGIRVEAGEAGRLSVLWR